MTEEEPAELFRVEPRPDDSARQYNFTQFAIGLNQPPGPAKSDGGVIGRPAPTDTTLRPDVRAMEEGNMTLAADEKHRLEVKQRAARKVRKDAGEHGEYCVPGCFPHRSRPYGKTIIGCVCPGLKFFTNIHLCLSVGRWTSAGEPPPRWFRKERDTTLDRDAWVFQGEYWTVRDAGAFEDGSAAHGCDDIY